MSDLLDLRFLLRLARETISDPRAGAAQVLQLALPRAALWLAFALMVVAAMILGEVVTLIAGPPEDGPLAGQSAFTMGLIQGAFLFLTVHAITHIGRLCGGTGDFDGALALVTWLQFVFLLVQLVQLALLLIAPPLSAIVSVLAIGLFLWLLVNFIAVLHEFVSIGMVILMTLLSFMGIVFVLGLVLSILGLGLAMGPPS